MGEYDSLWDVVRVALICMMGVQITGVYAEAVFPKQERVPVYECDFVMKESIMTRPCTIRGEWTE